MHSFGHCFLLNKRTIQQKACTHLFKKGLIGRSSTYQIEPIHGTFLTLQSEMQNAVWTYECIASCKSEWGAESRLQKLYRICQCNIWIYKFKFMYYRFINCDNAMPRFGDES